MWRKNTFVVAEIRSHFRQVAERETLQEAKLQLKKKQQRDCTQNKKKKTQHEHLDPQPIQHIQVFLPIEIPLFLQFVHKDVLYVVLVSVVSQLICFYLSSDSSYQSVHRAKPEWATV